jgi:hypothetical protein
MEDLAEVYVCFYIRESINFSLRPDLCVDQLEKGVSQGGGVVS